MNSADKAGPANNGPKILVIHALGCPPDEAALGQLLNAAGLNIADVKLTTPAEIAGGSVNPKDFDHVFALLNDELEADDQLEEGVLVVAQCGMGVTGIWGEDADSGDIHPALQKYGAQQIPWDPAQLSLSIISAAPQTFKSTTGGRTARHKTKHNNC